MYTRMNEPNLHSMTSISSDPKPDTFWRRARWCWDGSAILATREDKSLQIWSTPSELTEASFIARQAAPILDACWYPGARTSDAASFCLVASVRDSPVKLLDASDGRLRASYRIVDHVERFVAPHSITFNCSADKLYCGHRDAFEVFDLHRPGEGDRVHTISSRKSKDGMKGIISSMAFSPDYSGLFAAGSFSSALWLFAEGQGSDPVCQISGSSTSVSQVKFNPMQPQILYASFRMETHILAWDTRNATIPVAKYVRSGNVTNQRLWFDIDPSGRWLASGSDTGTVGFYDVSSSAETGQPMYTFAAHGDVVGSVAFHPSHPTVLTVSGSRHFEEEAYISEDDGSHPQHLRAKPVATEAMMKIWNI